MKGFLSDKDKKRKLIVYAVTTAVILTAMAVTLFVLNFSGQNNNPLFDQNSLIRNHFLVYASDEGLAGVETDAHFVIESYKPHNIDTIKAIVSAFPPFEYDLVRKGSKRFILNPKEPLSPNTVYNVLISEDEYSPPLSWAFQTKETFAVSSVFPRDGADYVDVTAGIEIRFSQPVDMGAADSFNISPKALGSFRIDEDCTLIFMPSYKLTYDTDYEIRLDAETLMSYAGDSLEEDYVFSFSTIPRDKGPGSEKRSIYEYDKKWETITSSDNVYIAFHADTEFKDATIDVSLYRFSDSGSYLSAIKDRTSRRWNIFTNTQGLKQIYSFSTKLTFTGQASYWDPSFFELPTNPGAGYYLVDIRTVSEDKDLNGKHLQRLLQISDISIYNMNFRDKALFWLNNADTGMPIQDADITLGEVSERTSVDGMAILQRSEVTLEIDTDRYGYNDYDYRVLNIRKGNMEYVDYLYLWSKTSRHLFDMYYTYVYTDREVYQPTDTVRFWGIILPRGASSKRPDVLHLDWTDGEKYPDGMTIKVEPDGNFCGEIAFERLVSGCHTPGFRLDDMHLTNLIFNIMEYEKPIYTINRKVDKDYYRKGEAIKLWLEGSFFDGTPVEGLAFSVNMRFRSNESQFEDIILNHNGIGEISFNTVSDSNWRPYTAYAYYSSVGAESKTIQGSKGVRVFPSDYMIKASADRTGDEDSRILLSVDGYSIDFTAVSDDDHSYMQDDYKSLEGGRADFSGTATLWETEYVKTKSGDYYDFNNKRVVDTYDYTSREYKRDTIQVTSADGRIQAEFSGYPDVDNKSYRVEIDCQTPDGSRLLETTYVYGKNFRSFDRDRGESFSFRIKDLADDNYNAYDDWGYSIQSYGPGEEVSMELVDMDRNKPEKGRIMYAVLGTDLFETFVSDENSLELGFDFVSKYVPNVEVVGAYFDGRHIYKVSPCSIRYKYKDSEIFIAVQPGKNTYKPGEEFSAVINTCDNRGLPLSARYVVSIADEAAFAVFDQRTRPLESMYSMIYLDYDENVSYSPFLSGYKGAEQGDGGGDDAIRSEFVDTAAFIQGSTDTGGRGEIRVKLPDNLTSWRITAIAFAEQISNGISMPRIGDSRTNFSVALPYFINAVVNERYIEGDSVGLTLRSAGTAIIAGSEASYELTLSGAGVNSNKGVSGKAGDFLAVDFGPLKQGTYKLRIKGSSGGYSDAVEREIDVTDSLLNYRHCIRSELGEAIDIKPTRYPVDLTFYDIENELFYDILYKLLYPRGNRADQLLTNILAYKTWAAVEGDAFVDSYYADPIEPDSYEVNAWRNGVRLWPYAEADPLLTAKLAFTSSEYLDSESMRRYFMAIVSNKSAAPEDVAAAYMGLGVLKAPVLFELRKLIQNEKDFDFRQRLHFAIGLAAIGDRDNAVSWFEGLFGDDRSGGGVQKRQSTDGLADTNIELDTGATTGETQVKAIRDGEYIHLTVNGEADYRCTAEIAMLTAIIGNPDATGYMAYLLDFDYYNYDPLPELAVWVRLYAPRPTQANLSYYRGDHLVDTLDFEDKRTHYIKLGETELAEARFSANEGHIGYQVSYTGGLEAAGKEAPPLECVRIIRKYDRDAVKLGAELTVFTEVSFDNQAVVSGYIVNVVVPSGFRLADVNEPRWNNTWDGWYGPISYSIGESGNLSYYIMPVYPDGRRWTSEYKGSSQKRMPDSVTLSHTIRAVLPGDFIMESDTYTADWSSHMYKTERSYIRVTP